MSSKRDYYEVLGVSRNATEKEIKKAYRKKAMKLHPDQYAGPREEAEELFKELNEAYSVLSDPEKRKIYDRFGHEGLKGAGSSAYSADPFDFFSSIFNFDLDSIFGGGFGRRSGGRRAQRGPSKGQDVVLEVKLTFEEAYSGVSKKIKLPFNKACPDCHGMGGTNFKTCTTCRGRGIVEKQIRSGMFIQITSQPCPKCHGRGQIPQNVCQTCKGKGTVNKREEITVRIPRGIDDGEAVRVPGKGKPSMDGGVNGDLLLRITLIEHPQFFRDGLDVYMKLPVDYPTLVLGGSIQVPIIGPKGEKNFATLKIPAGTQYNDILTLKNKGFVKKTRGYDAVGDMKYVINIKIPRRISKREKQLLEELKAIQNN